MQEIKCPNCGEVFQVDETGYAQIVSQIRDKEFEKELKRRESEIEQKKDNAFALQELKRNAEFKDQLDKKEQAISEKEKEIARLKNLIENNNTEKKLAVREALSEKENENKESLKALEEKLANKEREILKLEAKITAEENEKKLAIIAAEQKKDQLISSKENEIILLQGKLDTKESEHQLSQKTLKEQYEQRLKDKDEQIEYYKDFKAKQSTKMVGESLEQHCMIQFNSLRMTAFPDAYFEKDNDARSGSKGDFIFRESKDGTEFISIMFEMKNEMDETATKHKNEDFFKELDKDRREKNCEYAVLVSLLEADNEFYNNGIVDVSYRYEKMYVIRPQFFIPMITLLRNAALNSLKYQKELQIVRNQQIDIMHFEDNMNAFKEGFSRNYRLASEKFKTAIEEIDKTITHLQKTKEALLSSENNLRLANNKAEDLSIKKLTKNAPAVREMFEHQKD